MEEIFEVRAFVDHLFVLELIGDGVDGSRYDH